MTITDRLDDERAALLFRAIVDSSDDAIISRTLNGTITSWNYAAERLFGYTAEEAIGQCITILIPPGRTQEEPAIIAELKQGHRVEHFETVRQRKDGSLIDISFTISPVKDRTGTVIGASQIARDTSLSRIAERNSRLLSAIVDSSEDAIISKSLEGIITSWNKAAERLFGYTADEVIGKSITILIPPERLDEEPAILARLRRGERVDHFETVRRRKDGKRLDISLTISPVRDAYGRIIGASKIARDITAAKSVEAQMRQANKALEQFAFSVTHDLQEPLRSVKIYSELLMQEYEEKLTGDGLVYLRFLRSGASRMESLVRDLLAYTRAANEETQTELADADQALTETLEGLAAAITMSGATITRSPLPATRMGYAHLQQLFQNIISNALKYRAKDRPPTVAIRGERRGDRCVFAISDNGIGIDPQYKENIFGLFKRLHHGEYEGTGIGLAICQRIVDRYHGSIWVESEPGHGSTFWFSIPV